MSCAYADNNMTDINRTHENFTQLTNEISDSNGYLNITTDYIQESEETNVILSKSITLEGNNHTINSYDSIFNITTNNTTLTFKNILFKSKMNSLFIANPNITKLNITFINCNFSSSLITQIEVHEYGYEWGTDYSCKITNKIKKLAFSIIGKSTGLRAAEKLTKWVGKNIKYESDRGFYQTPTQTLKRKLGNCCCQTELLLQMMDAVRLTKKHKIYIIHVGNNKFHHRHYFAMIDNICVDPTIKSPWAHGNFKYLSASITKYPKLPLPYGRYG